MYACAFHHEPYMWASSPLCRVPASNFRPKAQELRNTIEALAGLRVNIDLQGSVTLTHRWTPLDYKYSRATWVFADKSEYVVRY